MLDKIAAVTLLVSGFLFIIIAVTLYVVQGMESKSTVMTDSVYARIGVVAFVVMLMSFMYIAVTQPAKSKITQTACIP